MISKNIVIPQDRIADFCRKHHIRRLSLFGSVLRDDFTPESDVDVLADFEPGFEPTLDGLLAMESELKTLFQRNVDFGERQSVEEDPNYLRRNSILTSAQIIYEG